MSSPKRKNDQRQASRRQELRRPFDSSHKLKAELLDGEETARRPGQTAQ